MAVRQQVDSHDISPRAGDDLVPAFLNRPLEGGWPSVRLDATRETRCEGGRIVAMAQMEGVVPRTRRLALIVRHSPKAGPKSGRPQAA